MWVGFRHGDFSCIFPALHEIFRWTSPFLQSPQPTSVFFWTKRGETGEMDSDEDLLSHFDAIRKSHVATRSSGGLKSWGLWVSFWAKAFWKPSLTSLKLVVERRPILGDEGQMRKPVILSFRRFENFLGLRVLGGNLEDQVGGILETFDFFFGRSPLNFWVARCLSPKTTAGIY